MKKSTLLAALMIQATFTFAQHARVTTHTAPLAGTVILRDLEDDKYNAQVFNLEMPSPDANIEKKRLNDVKRQISKQFPHRINTAARKTTAAPGPVVAMSFLADSLPGIPPDNDMAISKGNAAVSVINSSIAVLNGNTGTMSFRRPLKTFSSKVGLSTIDDYRYDPKVIYDPTADKFICVMLNATDARNWIVVGFSKTNDPAGQWNFYKFYGDYKADTTWFDYPSIAITKDEFFLTGNKIKFNTSWQAGFTETVIYQIDKKAGYDSAANITYKLWDGITYNGKTIRNLYPVKGGPEMMGPEQYFVSNRNFDMQNDTVFLVKVPDVISSGNTNLTVTALTSPLPYGVPPDGRQPDTGATLATNDGRILGAFAAYGEIQFVSTTLNTANGAAAVFHGKISNYQTSPAISHAQIISNDTLDFGYPNISFAGNPWGLNQALISFNYTGPNIYPGMAALLFDGAQYSDIIKVKEGEGSIKQLNGKQQRWGDYMGSQVDWSTPGAVWIEGIYGRADNRYGNWMAKLNSPLLNVKENAESKPLASTVYPNPAFQYISLKFEAPESEVMSFFIYNANGQMVDKMLETKCKKGSNTIQFDIGSLAAGTYYLKAVGANGAAVTTQSFVRN